MSPAATVRELVKAYQNDPGSLTPSQLTSVERLLRRRQQDKTRAAANGGDANPRTLLKEEVAQVLGKHPRTVSRYAAEGMPHTRGERSKPHLYNIAECLAWLSAQGRSPFQEEEAEPPDELTSRAGVELKLKRERGRLVELERMEREGALHGTAECRERRLRQLWALKREFLALARSTAPQLEGHDRTKIESILSARVIGILKRFAEGYLDGEAK